MIIERHDLSCEDDGDGCQHNHDADGEVQRGTGDMPGRFFIVFADHVIGKHGDEGRTERASRDHVKDQVGNEKCLQVGVGCRGCAKDKGEHRGAKYTQKATGDECAR